MYDETTYHIYAQDRCLYANLPEEEFECTWEMLKVMVGLLKTDYTEQDLSYFGLTRILDISTSKNPKSELRAFWN